MTLVTISVAFLAGVVAILLHLPPLVGFLVAGFGLNYFHLDPPSFITHLSDLGVALLLFTIGLKLNIRSLLSKEIWGSACLQSLLSTVFFFVVFLALKTLGITALNEINHSQLLLLGFILSFSSTVFAIKSIEEKGDMNATYATIAIGILIMQDILAVIFMTVSTGKQPSIYALGLILLWFARPVFYKILDMVGHKEMLVLFGVFFALVVGCGLFEWVGLKADLGALIAGVLLANHPRASELAKALFNIKELFLVCFFLHIGLSQEISLIGVSLALLLLFLLPIKGLVFFGILNLFKFRVRTSLLTSLTLANYSEFGLIVGALAYQLGWLSGDLIVAIALAVSFSFVFSAAANLKTQELYQLFKKQWQDPDHLKINAREKPIQTNHAQILILGMGRIGTGAYDQLRSRYGKVCLGIEIRYDSVKDHHKEGRQVIRADATDPDFWQRFTDIDEIKLILLAMPNHQGNQIAVKQLRARGFTAHIAAIAAYQDQIDSLLADGADQALSIYHEAGSGFAKQVCDNTTLDIHFTR